MTDAPPPAADEARTRRQWIVDLIRGEYDPKPSSWRAGETGWHDGAEDIADKILDQHEDGSTVESTIKDLMEHIAMLDERIALLSRITSDEATVDEDTIYIALLGTVGDELLSHILADLKSSGLRITRAPGAET